MSLRLSRFFRRWLPCACLVLDAAARQVPPPVQPGPGGTLSYTAEANGDRVVDFSLAGYGGGGVPLPRPEARVVVAPVAGDNGPRLQAALDWVGSLPPDRGGFRGTVVLAPGRFEVAGQLRLSVAGVVLRGAGSGDGGTLLVATGTDRRALIQVGGRTQAAADGPAVTVADERVPVGAVRLKLSQPGAFSTGDLVVIERPSPAAWIAALGMDDSPGRQGFEWKPGSMNVRWTRRVVASEGDELTLDAPLTVALEARYGGGRVWKTAPPALSQVGIEHLALASSCAVGQPADEDHAWTGIHVDGLRDGWVADVSGRHFAGSLVFVGAGASRVTVQDCVSAEPVSEDGGFRRMTFHVAGQQVLVQRCRSTGGRHDFTTGYLTAGPNVFLDCSAEEPRSFSGSVGSWASGVLFDNVRIDGAALRLDNLETWNQGVGWAAANSVAWQCSASVLVCRSPAGTVNWAVGPWAHFIGDGRWSKVNEFVKPESLYRAQLVERLGATALAALAPRPLPAPPAGPGLEEAVPDLAVRLRPKPPRAGRPLSLQSGWLMAGGSLGLGSQATVAWWRGSTHPSRAADVGPALTRFVPDRVGPGLTDDLTEVAERMVASRQVALRHNWGLWYDRRRDDHEMIRRADGDVWAPFFEQPWSRSGRGTASNGLSRYDLARFNPWYFGRLRTFAGLARERGLVLVQEMYFQHNILEAGAHWAEFPWRSANNVNGTGFPEPPPYAEGKRIFMADLFYDVSHPARRALHRAYIRQCLANLADEPNVLHTLGEEYSGPLAFVQFWLEVVGEWMRETGRRPLIALSAPKDVQDAILADPARAALISIVDLKYWWRTDRELYAPKGGANLSPRQHERLWKGGRPTAASLAAMVREMRAQFPDKAVITPLGDGEPWALAAAGASFVKLPAGTDPRLLASFPGWRPVPPVAGAAPRLWVLAGDGVGVLACGLGVDQLRCFVPAGKWEARRLDPRTGTVTHREPLAGGRDVTLPGGPGTTVVWIVPAAD